MKNNSTAGNGGKNTAKWNDRHTMPGEWTEKKTTAALTSGGSENHYEINLSLLGGSGKKLRFYRTCAPVAS